MPTTRLASLSSISFPQRYRASGLNLLVAAITLWNTVYLERAVASIQTRQTVNPALLGNLSPLSWEHIHLTGDYVWHANRRAANGPFTPLRPTKSGVNG